MCVYVLGAFNKVWAYLQQALLRDLGPSLDQVGLQQPRERRHVAWPLPEQRGQQRLEDGHVELRQRRCAQLYQLRKDLEDIGVELLQCMRRISEFWMYNGRISNCKKKCVVGMKGGRELACTSCWRTTLKAGKRLLSRSATLLMSAAAEYRISAATDSKR